MKPSVQQQNVYDAFVQSDCNINISAVAGSGKTTTLLGLLNLIPKGEEALFLAFNNTIVNELKNRIKDKTGIHIMTIHAFGWSAIKMRYGNRAKLNPNKVMAKTERALQKFSDKIPAKRRNYYYYICPRVVDLMRCHLAEPTLEGVNEVMDYHAMIAEPYDAEVILEAYKLVIKDKTQFDFTDMIFQPVIDSSIRVRRFPYIFCDESQDMSACQQELIRLAIGRKGRLVTVGDERQAIYGFAGADSESYSKLASLNGESVQMPLSVSYRCAKNIIKEAQEIVPEISYPSTADEGEVRWASLRELEYGDWILCRNLKPLIETYLWLMKNKIKSKIRGKDIGEGIINLITKTGAKTLSGLLKMLEIQRDKLHKKLSDKGVKHPTFHPKMELLEQQTEVLCCLINEVNSVKELKALIQNIFTDEVKGILLSTIHKAKGLENDTVFFLCPELLPSIKAIHPWQIEQEMNLKYVAITRAKKTLLKVDGGQFKDDLSLPIDLYHKNGRN